MALTHYITRSCNDGEMLTYTETVTGGAGPSLDESVPGASTRLLIALAFVVAKLQSIFIQCARDITLYTNTAPTTNTVTGATNATPIEITTGTAHGFVTGQRVTVASVGGNTAANGTWTITVTGASTFTLDTSVGNSNYTSGGTTVGAPQETIAIKASQPFLWTRSDGYFSAPFAGNVNRIYVTLAAGDAAAFKVKTIVDPT